MFFYHQPNSYPLVIQQFAIENGHLYRVDLHIEDGDFPSFFVGLPLKISLPEGKQWWFKPSIAELFCGERPVAQISELDTQLGGVHLQTLVPRS